MLRPVSTAVDFRLSSERHRSGSRTSLTQARSASEPLRAVGRVGAAALSPQPLLPPPPLPSSCRIFCAPRDMLFSCSPLKIWCLSESRRRRYSNFVGSRALLALCLPWYSKCKTTLELGKIRRHAFSRLPTQRRPQNLLLLSSVRDMPERIASPATAVVEQCMRRQQQPSF